jgi:CRISPR/Cas system CMR subunit Cmr4 (Cas7 group RAMP superfamily)
MRIERLGANQTVVHTSTASVLFSYDTPVAARILASPVRYIKTSTTYSKTTSKHVNMWLRNNTAETVAQCDLDALVA